MELCPGKPRFRKHCEIAHMFIGTSILREAMLSIGEHNAKTMGWRMGDVVNATWLCRRSINNLG